jgi:hypothetical protein
LGRARLTFKVGLRFRLVSVWPLNPVEAAAAAVMEAATEVATAGMSAAEAATGQRMRWNLEQRTAT